MYKKCGTLSNQKNIKEILLELGTSDQGLIEADAAERLLTYGLNEVSHEKPPAWYILFLKNFTNPFIALLIVLGIISYVLGDRDATIIISVMVIVSVLLRFVQEFRSNSAAEKLKKMVSVKATVIRRENDQSAPKKYEIDLKYLVPGDVIHLSVGDMVPADVRLIKSKDLFVSQAALTGESMPVEKYNHLSEKEMANSNLFEQPNMCFMGTNVLNGSATAVIVATGDKTCFGSTAKSILSYHPATSFDIGINKVTWLLIKFMCVMVPIVFVLNGLTKGEWFESLLFALSVAVGLTPEMLPMIVTSNLAKGAVNMSKSKVIVKRLDAIQNFGAMDVLCTDKTGTLTQDRVILEKHLGIEGDENEEVLKYAYLNSYYQTGLKNLLDLAVLEHTEMQQELHLDKAYQKVDEIPFDFIRRRMSVVVEKNSEVDLLVCKGAVEEILEICSQIRIGDTLVQVNEGVLKQARSLRDGLNEDGLRVLAVAYKELPAVPQKEYHVKDENALTLMGFIGFLDPPKQTTTKALENLKSFDIQVKVLTGDNEIVTQKICRWVGLAVEGVLNGEEIEKLSENELKGLVEKTTVFTRLTPLQKSRVIKALKSNGHIVGYLGDGINDAPALREADIGISVDTAVDIAKESADIIMLEKSLLFLGEGVIEGRKTFGNIIKYIKMAVSSNFGNVFSVLGASAFLPFLPMLPVQLLIQNLLYDLSQITIPFDKVDKEFLLKPRKWDPGGIAKFMIYIGPISSIFDYTTFALMWFVFGANEPSKQALFQSGWFVEGLLSQTLIVHMIRTQKIPFIQSIASFPLLLTTFLIMIVGIYIPYSYVGASVAMVGLPLSYYPWLFITLLSYCILTQIVKVWFIKKFHYWL